jgi:hypothetical protein
MVVDRTCQESEGPPTVPVSGTGLRFPKHRRQSRRGGEPSEEAGCLPDGTPPTAAGHRRGDTHKDLHVAAARDQLGRRLDSTSAPASRTGYAALLAWAHALGQVEAGQRVVEVNRPDRQARRRRGKSDAVDAAAAARAVQAGEATRVSKAQDGVVEMLRALRAARQTAVKARTQAVNALKGLLVSSSPACPLAGWSAPPPRSSRGRLATPVAAVSLALRGLGQRCPQLDARPRCSPTGSTGSPASMPRRCAACPASAPTAPPRCWSPPATPPTAALRGRVRRAVRHLAGPGLLRQDPPAPPQPRRGPPGQRGAAPRRGGAAALAPAHPRRRRALHRSGQDPQGGHALLKR